MYSRRLYGATHHLCLKVQDSQARMASQSKAPTAGMRRTKLWVCNDLNNTLTAQIIFVVAGEVDNAIALHLHHAGRQ